MYLLLLLVLACKPEADLTPAIEHSLIDQWQSTEDYIEWIGSPSCALISSDGTARVISPDGDMMGPVQWKATGPREFTLSHGVLKLGTLVVSQTDIGWKIEYSGMGHEGVAYTTPGCDYYIDSGIE